MTNVDLYQLCPCGSGKKLKFCCGADIGHELDAIRRALDGNQQLVALDLAKRAIAVKGPRPALLVVQAQLAADLEQTDVLEEATRELVKQRPRDPAALAVRSNAWIAKGD